MNFRELPIDGAWLIVGDRHDDARGTFARIWSASEFDAHGLGDLPLETSVSHNPRRLTLRGLHYQDEPHSEVKLVTCVSGTVWDVLVDLRPASPSYLGWHGVELRASEPATVYVPRGCAHGFLTLTGDATLLYQIATPFARESGRGIRWDDPSFAIDWPAAPDVISDRDRAFTDYRRR